MIILSNLTADIKVRLYKNLSQLKDNNHVIDMLSYI